MRYLGARRKLRAAEMICLTEPVFFGPFRVAPGGPGCWGVPSRPGAVCVAQCWGWLLRSGGGAADREDVIDSRKVIARLLAGACGGGGARCRVGAGYGSVCWVVVVG